MLPGHSASSAEADPPPAPAEELGRTTGASVVSGGLWSVLSRVLPQIQLLALSVVAARYLGPDGTGRQSFIAFVVITVITVATAGLPGALARYVGELLGARSPGVALSMYGYTVRVEALAALLSGLGIASVALFGGDPGGAWVLAGVVAMVSVLQATPQSLLIGAQRWRDASIVGIVTGLAAVPATIAVLAAGGGITGFFAVEAVVVFANLLWTTYLARRLTRDLAPADPVPPSLHRSFISFAVVSTGLAVIQYFVWRRSELIVLNATAPDSEIALYSIGFAIVFGLARIPEAASKVAMPAVATLVGAGEQHRVRSGFWRAMRLLAFMTPPVVAGAAATGPAVISLAYGSDFSGAGDVLLILLVPLLVLPMLMTAEALLFALGRLKFLFGVALAATVVDVTLSLIAIPPWEAVGAAVANAGAQLCAGVPCMVLAARLYGPVDVAWGPVIRGLVLAALTWATAALVLDVMGDGLAGVLVAVVAGIAVFAALAPVLRPLASDDAQWLSGALGVSGSGPRAVAGRAVLRLGTTSA
jgi:O-antigen/teichoic acid export membrane protein